MNRRDLLIAGGALGIVSFSNQSLAQPALGFYVPAEETRHQRTFMQWPNSRKVYSDRFLLEVVQQAIADIANTIAEFEPVVMLAAAKHQTQARRQLSSKVELWDIPTEDLWCRDAGPVFVVSDSGGARGQSDTIQRLGRETNSQP